MSNSINAKDNPGCDDALKVLGRITHSKRDYFGHAVTSSGIWIVFTTGEEPWPSSYPGEHPRIKEPAESDMIPADEIIERAFRSLEATQELFNKYLPLWWQKCSCWCKK